MMKKRITLTIFIALLVNIQALEAVVLTYDNETSCNEGTTDCSYIGNEYNYPTHELYYNATIQKQEEKSSLALIRLYSRGLALFFLVWTASVIVKKENFINTRCSVWII